MAPRAPLYTAEQKLRRDTSPWTLVQAILAPVQLLVFLVSVVLVLRYLRSGEGQSIATISIVAKTFILYAIMITGSIWEKEIFGCYLFAQAFFWEDVVSMLVLTLHTLYLWALLTNTFSTRQQMYIALAGYATYALNASQFLYKLRASRLQERATMLTAGAVSVESP